MKEKTIAHIAAEQLRALTLLKVDFVAETKHRFDRRADGWLFLGDFQQKFIVEVKNELRTFPAAIDKAFAKGAGVFIAGYITPAVKQQLKDNNINYIDTAGNCFIKYKNTFLFIDGQKITHVRPKAAGKLWTAPGLRYVWTLLQDTNILDTPYRTQAANAGVALGRIGDFINELEQQGFIAQVGKGWMFHNREALRDQWIELYPGILKPKLLLGKFRFLKGEVPADLPEKMMWGGEPAAAKRRLNLRPEIYTIYTWWDRETTMNKLKLLPDPDGKVLLYEGFWNVDGHKENIVPNTLLYAELMGTGDSRNIETAKRIAKK